MKWGYLWKNVVIATAKSDIQQAREESEAVETREIVSKYQCKGYK